jgi:hypothetical protein
VEDAVEDLLEEGIGGLEADGCHEERPPRHEHHGDRGQDGINMDESDGWNVAAFSAEVS